MLASEVMDQSCIYLNDVSKSLYTYDVQTPYLKQATLALELLFIANGLQVQRVVSSVIDVDALAKFIDLPNDFLLPISIQQRNPGDNDNQWVDMVEQSWEPTAEPNSYLEYWSFRNNKVNIAPCTIDKEVLMKYERSLAAISGENSLIDVSLSQTYLSAKLAELCARYIGMNDGLADRIAGRELIAAEDNLLRVFVLEGQTVNRSRRRKFGIKRLEVY